jgi:hypothetical protein
MLTDPRKSAINSSSGALKSSGTLIFPLSNPSFLRRGLTEIGVRRAMGLPALAMITSAPAATSSTMRERWVFGLGMDIQSNKSYVLFRAGSI